MLSNNSENNNNQMRLHFSYIRQNCEILDLDDKKVNSEPLQLPVASSSEMSSKQAFFTIGSGSMMNLDDFNVEDNFCYDSDNEVLLSDSDDEDNFQPLALNMDHEQTDAETAIDSEDLNELSEGDLSDDDSIEESLPRAINKAHSYNCNSLDFNTDK